MKFRSEVLPRPLEHPISHHDRILSLGSCFAEEMARKLREGGFTVECNPTGPLFNPESIARLVERLLGGKEVRREELILHEGLYHHPDFHGSFSDSEAERALERMNEALARGAEALKGATVVLLTWGTARVYELDGCVVANCHKLPSASFRQRMLGTEELEERWSRLLDGPLRDKRTIMTLSPVRHLRDSAEDNSLSKALLRVAMARLAERFPQLDYFPAYEILLDDLRDYRFYAADLAHPSAEAVEYIWERFLKAAFTPESEALVRRVEQLQRALRHRSLHPESTADRQFREATRRAVEQLARETGIRLMPSDEEPTP